MGRVPRWLVRLSRGRDHGLHLAWISFLFTWCVLFGAAVAVNRLTAPYNPPFLNYLLYAATAFFWISFLLFTIAVVRWINVRDRIRAGLCATCGYDLRASPDRCPECGTTPAAK